MNDTIAALEQEVSDAKARLREARRAAEPEPVEDWPLARLDGTPVRLSDLFGDHDELLVVHNMGGSCSYCSLWADGFSGLAPQFKTRCGFVLCSDDPPAVAAQIKADRAWHFRVVSGHGSGFAAAMGYRAGDGKPWPGVSAFKRGPDGSIVRTGHAPFGPGDDFCAVWPMLDLLPARDWHPR
tara:strand:+ start:3808 stop:4353 length:546 start_codon:yes stop_codon:yes gene_type:complete